MVAKKYVNGVLVDLSQEEIDFIESERLLVSEEEQATEYIKLRQEEYPSIGDQLDMKYWDKVNNTTICYNLLLHWSMNFYQKFF